MSAFLRRIQTIIDKLSHGCFVFACFCCFTLTLLTFEQVIARYFLSASSMALQELEWHLFGLLILLSAAHGLKSDTHVRVDLLYNRFRPSTRRLIDAFYLLIIALPAMGLIVYYGIDYVNEAFQTGEISPNPDGLRFRWLIKASIPFGFLLIALQVIAELTKLFVQDPTHEL